MNKVNEIEKSLNKTIEISNILSQSDDFNIIYEKKSPITDKKFMKIESVENKPDINFGKMNPNKFYSLVMVDPDVPKKFEGGGFYIHWAKVNIKDSNRRGDTICKYQAPNPPAWDGEHRYFFILYEQSDEVEKNNIECKRLYKKYNNFVKELGVIISGKKLKYFITKN